MLMVLLKSLYLVDYIQLVLIDLLYKLEEVVAIKYSLNSCLFEGENGPLRGPPLENRKITSLSQTNTPCNNTSPSYACMESMN